MPKYRAAYYCGTHDVRSEERPCPRCLEEDEQRGKPARPNLMQTLATLDGAWMHLDAVSRHNPHLTDDLREAIILTNLARRSLHDILGYLEE